MKFSEQQIKEAFWKEFHQSGELWFPYYQDGMQQWEIDRISEITEASWLEFFETLVEIAGGYNGSKVD